MIKSNDMVEVKIKEEWKRESLSVSRIKKENWETHNWEKNIYNENGNIIMRHPSHQ